MESQLADKEVGMDMPTENGVCKGPVSKRIDAGLPLSGILSSTDFMTPPFCLPLCLVATKSLPWACFLLLSL